MADKKIAAQQIWEATLKAYGQDEETLARITLPLGDVVEIYLSLAANIIAQIPDASDRNKMVGLATPMLDRTVRKIRNQPSIYLPRGTKSLDAEIPTLIQ